MLKGSYALILHLAETREISVGGLGAHLFHPGHYIYFGSALNSLEGRLRRHVRVEKKLHWHVDYLLEEAAIQQIWWAPGSTRRECVWTQAALEHPGSTVPVKGFGSSDCRKCPSHLLYVPSPGDTDSLARLITSETLEDLTISYPDSTYEWNALIDPLPSPEETSLV